MESFDSRLEIINEYQIMMAEIPLYKLFGKEENIRAGQVMGLLFSSKYFSSNNPDMGIAAKYGQLKILKYIKSNSGELNFEVPLTAARSGHLHILKWIKEQNPLFFNDESVWKSQSICAAAACSENLDILKWARENGCKWNSQVCYNAAAFGHTEILKWAKENGAPEEELSEDQITQARTLLHNFKNLRSLMKKRIRLIDSDSAKDQ